MSKEDIISQFIKFQSQRPARATGLARIYESPTMIPSIHAAIESLIGVPVFDLLEGYKGQIIGYEVLINYTDHRHKLPTTAWRIRLGTHMTFVKVRTKKRFDPYAYPLIVMGVLTPYKELLKQNYQLSFGEYRVEQDVWTVAVDDIYNITQVMKGACPFLLTDKHGIRDVVPGVSEHERMTELTILVERLTKELQKQQIATAEAERNVRMAESLATQYRVQLDEMRERLMKTTIEWGRLWTEYEKVVQELRTKYQQLEISDETQKRFAALLEETIANIDRLAVSVRRLGEQIEEEAEEAESPQPAQPPTQRTKSLRAGEQ